MSVSTNKALVSQVSVRLITVRLMVCVYGLYRLQNRNGKQQTPISTAMVSMVHSVPELMVSSEVRCVEI